MSPKNLSVKNKTHKFLLNKLKNKRIFNIYKKYEANLNINENFIVAVSGGPDSLALSFLSKIYSIKNSLDSKYFLVNHKLRENSTSEANNVRKSLKKISVNLNILNWKGPKPETNIQSVARDKRYNLLIEKAKKCKINYILVGHHLDDLFENFFIRIIRGSGLKGLVSLGKKTQKDKINIIRPLLDLSKNDLIYISNNIFGFYVDDPSNKNDKFKRVKIRNLLKQLENEGLDRNKFLLTINNLKISNNNITFYTNLNLRENATFIKKKESFILKEKFFQQSEEVTFRSLTEIIKFIGKKHYPPRGKKIVNLIKLITNKSYLNATLGGCLIKKVKQTVIIKKEQ